MKWKNKSHLIKAIATATGFSAITLVILISSIVFLTNVREKMQKKETHKERHRILEKHPAGIDTSVILDLNAMHIKDAVDNKILEANDKLIRIAVCSKKCFAEKLLVELNKADIKIYFRELGDDNKDYRVLYCEMTDENISIPNFFKKYNIDITEEPKMRFLTEQIAFRGKNFLSFVK